MGRSKRAANLQDTPCAAKPNRPDSAVGLHPSGSLARPQESGAWTRSGGSSARAASDPDLPIPMNTPILPLITLVMLAAGLPAAGAPADAGGGNWVILFDGGNLDAWQDAGGGKTKWTVEDGAMIGQKGSGNIWTKARYGDFVLELEFKTTGNSGVFLRTDDPKNCVQTGIEIQVDNPRDPDRHSVGAIYDLVAPAKNAGKADDWNRLTITAKGAQITVELNGAKVAEMDLDRWTEAGKNPDGTNNKFKRALKDWKREGHIGFQAHGAKVWYRKVRLKAI